MMAEIESCERWKCKIRMSDCILIMKYCVNYTDPQRTIEIYLLIVNDSVES